MLKAIQEVLGPLQMELKTGGGVATPARLDDLVALLDAQDLLTGEMGDRDKVLLIRIQAQAANVLRKAGRPDDALRLARRASALGAADIWTIRAHGWALRDSIRKANAERNESVALELVCEFEQLPIPDEEDLLLKQREYCRSAVSDPAHALRRQAQERSKQGDHVQAAALYRDALRSSPCSRDAQTGLGWELAWMLKQDLAGNAPDPRAVRGMLREFLSLGEVDRPSALYSLMLAHATRAQPLLGHLYVSFVAKWGVQHLREEDYQPYAPAGREEKLPSLAERAGMALGKAARAAKRVDRVGGDAAVAEARCILTSLVGRFPKNMWLAYHYARVLALAGEPAAAREVLLPIVRAKVTEFWVWDALADTYPVHGGERLACLAHAALSRVRDRGLLGGVFSRLRDELVHAGEAVAARELGLLAPARRRAGEALADEASEDPGGETEEGVVEFDGAVHDEPVGSAEGDWELVSAVLARYAPLADEIACEGLPWSDGVVSGRVEPRREIKGSVFVLYRQGERLVEGRCRLGRFPALDGARMGDAIEVRVCPVEGHDAVVAARARSGGSWDVLPERAGVVKDVNAAKDVAAVAVGADEVVLARFDRFPEARSLTLGQGVRVRALPSRGEAPGWPVSIRPVTELPDTGFCRAFSGCLAIRSDKGFGFVGTVYVSRALAAGPLPDGCSVEGVAILETNPRTGQKGWRAISLRSRGEN